MLTPTNFNSDIIAAEHPSPAVLFVPLVRQPLLYSAAAGGRLPCCAVSAVLPGRLQVPWP
jgi:hypothetical protein